VRDIEKKLIAANMQSKTGFASSHQLKSYITPKSHLKLLVRCPEAQLLNVLLQVGCSVEVHKPDSTRYLEATLTRITDHSLYTVGMLYDYRLT